LSKVKVMWVNYPHMPTGAKPGWRVGMVMGASEHINHILKVKSNMDSGMFYGIQKGAIEALKCSKMWFATLNNVYKKRRNLVWKLAEALNWF